MLVQKQAKVQISTVAFIHASFIQQPTKSFMPWYKLSQYFAFFLYKDEKITIWIFVPQSPSLTLNKNLFFFFFRTPLCDLDMHVGHIQSCLWQCEREKVSRFVGSWNEIICKCIAISCWVFTKICWQPSSCVHVPNFIWQHVLLVRDCGILILVNAQAQAGYFLSMNTYERICLGWVESLMRRWGTDSFLGHWGRFTVCCYLRCQLVEPKICMLSWTEKTFLCMTVMVSISLLNSAESAHTDTLHFDKETTACHSMKCQ